MFSKLLNLIRSRNQEAPMLSPLPERASMVSPDYEPPMKKPAPTPTPAPARQFRNPLWNKWSKINPKSFQELLSGTKIASKETGVPQDILMDIPGIESSGGQFMRQLSGGPGRGYYQFEPGQAYIPPNFDYDSATESARLAAKRIKSGNLSNWGTPQGGWGSLNNLKNSNGKLTDWYSPEELNQFLAPKFRL